MSAVLVWGERPYSASAAMILERRSVSLRNPLTPSAKLVIMRPVGSFAAIKNWAGTEGHVRREGGGLGRLLGQDDALALGHELHDVVKDDVLVVGVRAVVWWCGAGGQGEAHVDAEGHVPKFCGVWRVCPVHLLDGDNVGGLFELVGAFVDVGA